MGLLKETYLSGIGKNEDVITTQPTQHNTTELRLQKVKQEETDIQKSLRTKKCYKCGKPITYSTIGNEGYSIECIECDILFRED